MHLHGGEHLTERGQLLGAEFALDEADGFLALSDGTALRSARLEYRVTGHGGGNAGTGCVGPAEEFCKRTHTVTFDGEKLAEMQPWRADCQKLCTIAHQGAPGSGFDYCKENPCGAISSVRAPRANWCPGSLTPPFAWEDAKLATPGKHTLAWSVAPVVESGGTWRTSAHLFAYGD